MIYALAETSFLFKRDIQELEKILMSKMIKPIEITPPAKVL
jgi:hypothetical protein